MAPEALICRECEATLPARGELRMRELLRAARRVVRLRRPGPGGGAPEDPGRLARHLALRGLPALRGAPARSARAGLTPLDRADRLAATLGLGERLDQERRGQPDPLLQGPRGRGRAREGAELGFEPSPAHRRSRIPASWPSPARPRPRGLEGVGRVRRVALDPDALQPERRGQAVGAGRRRRPGLERIARGFREGQEVRVAPNASRATWIFRSRQQTSRPSVTPEARARSVTCLVCRSPCGVPPGAPSTRGSAGDR